MLRPSADTTMPAAPTPEPSGTGTGRFMVFVWALEQRGAGRRHFDAQAMDQDVLVPWVLAGRHAQPESAVHQRCT